MSRPARGFADSHLGRLRAAVGTRLLLLPGARAIVEDGAGRILFQHRSDLRRWGLPGGVPEEGETLEEAMRRELAEETGLRAGALVPFAHSSDPRFETIVFPNGDACQFFSMNYWAREPAGQLRRDAESLELAWRRPDDPPDLLPNMRRSVEAFARFRASGAFQLI